MSVPQRGVDSEGAGIPRTDEEEAIFNECLPSMGTLYSTFPVLALTEAPPGDDSHDYFGSGWCTCELTVATLGKQLQTFSMHVLGDHRTPGGSSMYDKGLEDFD